MKFFLKITGITKVTDEKLLVQLQGKYGHASLNLPLSQQGGLKVGDELTLEAERTSLGGYIGAIDEESERLTATTRRTLSEGAKILGAEAGLSGVPLGPPRPKT